MENGRLQAWSAIVSSWERPGSQHYPKGLSQNESNFNALQVYLKNAIAKGVEPSMENWKVLVEQAKADGRLQFDTPQIVTVTQVVEPKVEEFKPEDHLPHPGEPSLKSLRTISDIQNLTKEKVQRFLQPAAIDSGLKKKFDERVQHIQKHGITELSSKAIESAPRQAPTIPPVIAQARRAVEEMTVADIGMTGSAAGRHQLLINKKRKFHENINEAWTKGVRHEVILERTRQAIKDAGSSSIR